MPPTEVRPQTFAVLQQPDSASPAVRFKLKLQSTCCLVILPVQAVLVRVPCRTKRPRGRTAFCTEPYISSFQGASYLLLGFRFSVQNYCTTARIFTV